MPRSGAAALAARQTLTVLLAAASGCLLLLGAVLAIDPSRRVIGALNLAAGVLVGAVLVVTLLRPPSRAGAEWLIAGTLVLGVALQGHAALDHDSSTATPILGLLLAAGGGFLLRPGPLAVVAVATVGAWLLLLRWAQVLGDPLAEGSILLTAGALGFVFQTSRRRTMSRLEAQRTALRDSERRFRQIAEGVHEVFWVQDAQDGRLLYVSPRYRELWGRDPEDLLAGRTTFLETVHPEDRARVAALLPTQADGTYEAEYRIVRAEGGVRWTRDRAYCVVEDGQRLVIGVVEDITDRKALEERYRLLFHGMPTPAWVYDFDTTRILEVNDAAIQGYGFTREEFLSKTLVDLRPPEDVPKFLAARAKIDPRKPRQVEARHVKADGSVVDVIVTAANFEVLGSRVALAVCQDVTEKNRANEAARRNERLASLGTLVAGVAHEINNPLTYMRGNAELIEMELEDAMSAATLEEARRLMEAAREKLDPVLHGMDQIRHITTSLKQVARKPTEKREATDLCELAKGALVVAGPRMPEGTAIRTSFACPVYADVVAGEVSQILLNLLFNAADAVADGASPEIHVRAWTEGDRAMLLVGDNGRGIPEAARTRLFTPFHTTKANGTGLGLSTSLSIAREHGGDLSFETREGRGTSFVLALPLSARHPRPAASPS